MSSLMSHNWLRLLNVYTVYFLQLRGLVQWQDKTLNKK